MYNYDHVVGFRVGEDSQEWVRKIWKQNLEKYKIKGGLDYKEGRLRLYIDGKPKTDRLNNLFNRFLKKLHNAGIKAGGDIMYVLEDGKEVSPRKVLTTSEIHKLRRYLRGER